MILDDQKDTFRDHHYWYKGEDEDGNIDPVFKDLLMRYDAVYEKRKDVKCEDAHYRVTFEKKSFSPIGEVRWWSVNGTPFGTAEHTYLHDALVHPFAIHYSWAIHDIVYTKRKKQKLWTKPFLSALLKGLGYELV